MAKLHFEKRDERPWALLREEIPVRTAQLAAAPLTGIAATMGRSLGTLLCVGLCTLCLHWPAQAQTEEPADAELIRLVVELLDNDDKQMRALGFDQVRTAVPGSDATRTFAARLAELTPEAQVGLLSALADRGDPIAKAQILPLLNQPAAEQTRVAAIEALGALGRAPEDVDRLVALLATAGEPEQVAARRSLTRLPGKEAGRAIAAAMAQQAPPIRTQLIEILAARRGLATIPDILEAAVDPETQVRAAAMQALGEMAAPEHLGGMLLGVLAAEEGSERVAAEKCVMFVCQRIPNADQHALPLIAAVDALAAPERLTLLTTLGRVGGPAVLRRVEAAIADRDSVVHDKGVRALCLWPNASIAPRLLELAAHDSHAGHRRLALKALIRVAPLPDERPDRERLELLRTVMGMCDRDKDRNRVLQRASAIRTLETLRFVAPYLRQPRYAEQACETVVELAHHRNLREPNEAEFHRALDLVIETSQNATVVDRARRYKRDETWVRPRGS